mmetsp:Transcript_6464/g.11634  ORF Transcript_6464/g.11634 Transcript_6464/m.11634 type:complete len:211 (+) Transcript_6464:598-1230(+)
MVLPGPVLFPIQAACFMAWLWLQEGQGAPQGSLHGAVRSRVRLPRGGAPAQQGQDWGLRRGGLLPRPHQDPAGDGRGRARLREDPRDRGQRPPGAALPRPRRRRRGGGGHPRGAGQGLAAPAAVRALLPALGAGDRAPGPGPPGRPGLPHERAGVGRPVPLRLDAGRPALLRGHEGRGRPAGGAHPAVPAAEPRGPEGRPLPGRGGGVAL